MKCIAILIIKKMKKIITLTIVLILNIHITTKAQNMTTEPLKLNAKQLEFAKTVIKDFGDKIPVPVQQAMLAQVVILGMPPYEAHLAAGAFSFRVVADPAKWPDNADPYRVMWAQSTKPDESQIWMLFENETQYPSKEKTKFRVIFKSGKAAEIIIVQ